jgi:hypothetical protein
VKMPIVHRLTHKNIFRLMVPIYEVKFATQTNDAHAATSFSMNGVLLIILGSVDPTPSKRERKF